MYFCSMKKEIYTIGHSNRSIADFLKMLTAFRIEKIIDVRTIPRSRHNPQYNQKELRRVLAKAKIKYEQIKELGGLRRAKRNSINLGWRNVAFRGFADYMETLSFWQGIEKLEKIVRKYRAAIMCAEALPWRCHRSLIADALVKKKGFKVFHIQSAKTARSHRPTPFLKLKKGLIVYP